MSEYMLNNLRLTNTGVAESGFRLRFGCGLFDVYLKEIEELAPMVCLNTQKLRKSIGLPNAEDYWEIKYS
jgi:hypothetical protein